MQFFPSTVHWAGLLAGLVWAGAVAASGAPAAPSVYLEELTSPELHTRITQGSTEQNGPHMVLGKHNVRVRALAGQIAQQLGTAVVAPVLAYVPEGSTTPPAAHMRFSGTVSISDTALAMAADPTLVRTDQLAQPQRNGDRPRHTEGGRPVCGRAQPATRGARVGLAHVVGGQ